MTHAGQTPTPRHIMSLHTLKGSFTQKWQRDVYLLTPCRASKDVGDLVSSVEHKQRCLTQSVSVCQSYNDTQWDSRLWEREKKCQTQIKPAARDDTLRPKDTKRSVCARNWTVFISFFIQRNVQLFRAKCITTIYLSNGPLTLYLQSQLGGGNALTSLRSAVKQDEEEENASRAGCCERTCSGQLDRAVDQR